MFLFISSTVLDAETRQSELCYELMSGLLMFFMLMSLL